MLKFYKNFIHNTRKEQIARRYIRTKLASTKIQPKEECNIAKRVNLKWILKSIWVIKHKEIIIKIWDGNSTKLQVFQNIHNQNYRVQVWLSKHEVSIYNTLVCYSFKSQEHNSLWSSSSGHTWSIFVRASAMKSLTLSGWCTAMLVIYISCKLSIKFLKEISTPA